MWTVKSTSRYRFIELEDLLYSQTIITLVVSSITLNVLRNLFYTYIYLYILIIARWAVLPNTEK